MSVINPESIRNPAFRWFAEARFGMFVHFSLASMLGKDLAVQYKDRIPYKDYEALAGKFNPQRFSAREWVDLAQRAGARYIVPLAKHAEGFCLWDTDTTQFKITRTPFGRDIIRELTDECHQRDLRIMLYFNQGDWHSRHKPNRPGAWGDRFWSREDDEPDWDKHTAYTERQLEELLKRYGRIDGVWFDGTSKSEKHWRGRRLYAHIKRLQPECLVNDRAFYGDFLTPEWELTEELDSEKYLVEQCVSVASQGWGWDEKASCRSAVECVDMLVRMAGCGANLLLNVGPDREGVIPVKQAARMREIGRWLKRNGEAIYGTQGLKLVGSPDLMRATRRGDDIYLLLRRWPEHGRIEVPGIRGLPASARLLEGPDLVFRQAGGRLVLDGLPSAPSDALAQVIQLHFPSAPAIIRPLPKPHTITTVPLAPDQPTLLSVKHAELGGFSVKGWQHSVRRLVPPDASFGQGATELPAEADQPYAGEGPAPVRGIHAIIDWRHTEQHTTWTVEASRPTRVKVRVLLRCQRRVAGSAYELRCGAQTLSATVKGNEPQPNEDYVGTDWFRGFYRLPFVWEEAGEMKLPSGQSRITMQPVEIPWGSFFADVAALELTPVQS
jgi:alpha-L-fucosidase